MAMGGIPWDLRRRGLKDSLRHDERVKEALRKNLRHLIVEETIIASNGNRTVKVPIRLLDQCRFRYADEGEPRGVGHGPAKPGQAIAGQGDETAADGSTPSPGDLPGDVAHEAEVTVEALTEAMLEDLNLPNLREIDAKAVTREGVRFDDVRKKGVMANLDKRRTLYENLKRQAAKGRARVGALTEDDLRFKVWRETQEPASQAAVYMLMDRSASMSADKRYIVKSFYFWLTRFLNMKYDHVELVFVAHDVKAEIVTEEEFFTVTSGGGTRCSSAFAAAQGHMRVHHPASLWNVYLFHFSDGENLPSDNPAVVSLVRELAEACRMVGYGEVQYTGWGGFYHPRGPANRAASPLHAELSRLGVDNLTLVTIGHKDEIYPALKRFLSKDGAA